MNTHIMIWNWPQPYPKPLPNRDSTYHMLNTRPAWIVNMISVDSVWTLNIAFWLADWSMLFWTLIPASPYHFFNLNSAAWPRLRDWPSFQPIGLLEFESVFTKSCILHNILPTLYFSRKGHAFILQLASSYYVREVIFIVTDYLALNLIKLSFAISLSCVISDLLWIKF